MLRFLIRDIGVVTCDVNICLFFLILICLWYYYSNVFVAFLIPFNYCTAVNNARDASMVQWYSGLKTRVIAKLRRVKHMYDRGNSNGAWMNATSSHRQQI